MGDILFHKDDYVFSYRVAGVLLHGNKILLQKPTNDTGYALPGGHVKIGESSIESLIREYKEETGADIICSRLIWVEENFWKWNGKDTHGVAFYYLISLKNDSDIPDGFFKSHKDNCNVMLEWVTIEEMKELTIYPLFLKEKIDNISDNIEHFMSYE